MAGDDRGLLQLPPEETGGRQRHIVVAGPVEPVLADAVLLVIFVGDRVKIGLRRHGLVELGVENTNVRDPRHRRFARLNPGEVGRIVQRPERETLPDDLLDLLVDHHRGGNLLAAVENPVSDRDDLPEVGNDTALRIDQLGADLLESLLQILDRNDPFKLVPVTDTLVDHVRLVGAEPLELPLGQNRVVGHREQRVLHRAAAGIDHQYFHGFPSFHHNRIFVKTVASLRRNLRLLRRRAISCGTRSVPLSDHKGTSPASPHPPAEYG